MTDAPLQPNASFQDGAQYVWDSTSISIAQTCMRKYHYKMIDGWRSVRESVHLIFGGVYATAQEHYLKFRFAGQDKSEATVNVVHEALEATWERPACEPCSGYGFISTPYTGSTTPELAHAIIDDPCENCNGNGTLPGHAWDSGDNLKTRETLIRTIVWYIEQFDENLVSVITLSDGSPAVEYTFKLPVDNGIIFSGHIDRLVTYSDDPYVMDQKTTGTTISPRYFDQFSPNTQMSMYTFASQMIYSTPVKGVIIDAAQIAVGFSRFERGFTFRTSDQLTEWYDETMSWIVRAREQTLANEFPMNPAACGNYGGCEFRMICSKSPQVREQFLKGNFVQGPRWDPSSRR